MGTLTLLLALAIGHAQSTPDAASTPDTPPSTVSADEERARELFDNGATLYAEGSYEAAILAFEEAYRLSRRPALLLNIASAQERLGQWQEARATLDRYRAFARPEEREALDRRIRNVEQRAVAAAEPAPPPPAPEPEPPPVVAQAPLPLPPTPVRRDGRARRTAGFALLGTGIAVGGGFGAVAGWTWARSRPLIDAGDEAGWNDLRGLNNASVGAAIGGGALALTGIVLAAIPVRTPVLVPTAAVAPTTGGAHVTLTWTLAGGAR